MNIFSALRMSLILVFTLMLLACGGGGGGSAPSNGGNGPTSGETVINGRA